MTHARIAPGCRRLSPAHVQAQAIAERFDGLPDGVSKGQALAAFKQAAQPLGLSPRLRDAIDALFAFSAPQDWQPGARPIVWPSNRKLETTLGLGRRQVQNVLSALIRARLITPVDSPTGRRWRRRDVKTGAIVEAYGFDLSPIGQRHAEFVALAERAAAEERERAALRRRLTIARKAIQQIAETAIEHRLTDRDWRYWLAEALTLVLTIRDDLPLEDLQAVVAELEQRRTAGEAALRAAFDSVQTAPAGATECTPITTTKQPQADKSATRNIDSQERNGQGDSPALSNPLSPERLQQVHPTVTPKFVLTVSPALKSYLFTPSPNWADIVEAANGLRQQLGISRSAWIDACQAMGRYQAATAVAVIAAKREIIRSPGGYLRGMIGRAHNGELHLSNSLWGLARRERSPETYDA
jgi:replication initiation protein RepC